MMRRRFVQTGLAIYPLALFARIKTKYLTRTGKGFKVNAGEARFGKHYRMKVVTLNTLDIKISESDTNGELAVFEQSGSTPFSGPPLHIHPYQDEWFYVLEGEYLFQAGDEKFQLGSGDTVFLPRNIQHAFIQMSETGKMIVSYLPAGKMEAFFKVTDSWTLPPKPEEIAKIFEEHDMKVVGPPLKADHIITQ